MNAHVTNVAPHESNPSGDSVDSVYAIDVIARCAMNDAVPIRPYFEVPERIATALAPEGKRVLTIGGYGGFALWFLAKGARAVATIDCAPQCIVAQDILRAAIVQLDFDAHVRFMHAEYVPALVGIPRTLVRTYRGYLRTLLRHVGKRELPDFFPQLVDCTVYAALHNALRQGAWEVIDSEFCSCMERCAVASYDIAYIATVRNWVYSRMCTDANDEDGFTAYDERFARAVHRLLRPGGVVAEATAAYKDFPRHHMDTEKTPLYAELFELRREHGMVIGVR